MGSLGDKKSFKMMINLLIGFEFFKLRKFK